MFTSSLEQLGGIGDRSKAAGIGLFIRPLPRPRELLTLIVTTSVIPAHPSTRLIAEVLGSYVRNEPDLLDCKKIIVCDFPKLSVSGLTHYKSGKINRTDFQRYEEYIGELERLSAAGEYPFVNVEIFRLPRYRGFAMAVHEALAKVTTPFVMIIQHDRVLTREFRAAELLALMQAQPDQVKYIGLCSDTSSGHVHQVSSRYNMDVTGKMQILQPTVPGAGGLEAFKKQLIANFPLPLPQCRMLVPLIFWYDSTHIASVSHYRDFVFGSHELVGVPTLDYRYYKLKTGDFIEDKLGQVQREDIKCNGLDEAHGKYATFLLEDNQGPFVRHCHGRMIGTSTKRTFEIYFGNF